MLSGTAPEKLHDREVLTTATGALIQHDASHHLWSPYAQEKWVLISSLDDYSRKLLYADLFKAETTWAHYQEEIRLRHVPPGEEVEVHLIPNMDRETLELRVWWKDTNVQSLVYPFKAFPRVHF